jgi:hypothetical protein
MANGFIEQASDAFQKGAGKVAKHAEREIDRALRKQVTQIDNDFDSIAGAIDKGGLLAGAIQVADVFSPGHQVANGLEAWRLLPSNDTRTKELVSAGVNLGFAPVTGLPGFLIAAKDVADALAATEVKPNTTAAAAHGAERPRATGASDGYAGRDVKHSGACVHESQAMSLHQMGELLAAIRQMREDRASWVAEHPNASTPTDGCYSIDEILNNDHMSTGEVCVRIVGCIVHEHPECVAEIGDATGTAPPQAERRRQPAPSAPGADANPLAGIFGFLGPMASFLGPLLGNPIVGTLLMPLLAATPLAPIAPFLPLILPIAGSALSMAGGAMTQIGSGGGMPGGGPTPDFLGQLLQAVPAMLGGTPTSPAPVLAS